MNPQVEATKAEFERTSSRLLKNLAATPDDKLKWSPSPTARTPLELAYHAADVIEAIQNSIDGKGVIPTSVEQIDSSSREHEKNAVSREQVTKKFEDASAAYVAWLDALTDEKLASTWQSPFGPFPVSVGITFPALHAGGHIAQLEYIQTIYGDRVWH